MRQAIIEATAIKLFNQDEHSYTWENARESLKYSYRKMSRDVLEAAGFFELLEAAEEITKRIDTEIEDTWIFVPLDDVNKLDAAISRAKGDWRREWAGYFETMGDKPGK